MVQGHLDFDLSKVGTLILKLFHVRGGRILENGGSRTGPNKTIESRVKINKTTSNKTVNGSLVFCLLSTLFIPIHVKNKSTQESTTDSSIELVHCVIH